MTTRHAYELGYAAGLLNETRQAPFDGDRYANAWHEGFADARADTADATEAEDDE